MIVMIIMKVIDDDINVNKMIKLLINTGESSAAACRQHRGGGRRQLFLQGRLQELSNSGDYSQPSGGCQC